jgi:hypothetical protein
VNAATFGVPGLVLLMWVGGDARGQSLASVMPVAERMSETVTAGTVGAIPVKLDPPGVGDDLIHVIFRDASLKISLEMPGGVVVNSENASALGYKWTRAGSAAADHGDFPLAEVEGEHVLIGLPPGAAPGAYIVRVDARTARTDEMVSVEVMLSANVTAAVSVPWDRYLVSETVKITGKVSEETQTVKSPTMRLEVTRRYPVSLGLRISDTRLVGTQALPGGGYRHDFTADLVSRDVTAAVVIATVKSALGAVDFLAAELTFQGVKAGATTSTTATISVRTESSQTPSMGAWVWTFDAIDPPVEVPILDSGEQDRAPGDGVFTGIFTPTKPGQYSAVVTAAGSTRHGAAYRRVASTGFRVVVESGSVLGCTDRARDTDGNGLFDRLTVTMQVRVPEEASYRVSLELADSLNQRATTSELVQLRPGDSAVPLTFDALTIRRQLPGKSPYRAVFAQIWMVDGYSVKQVASGTCGETKEYDLSSFEVEPARLTGTPTLVPVDQNGIRGFEHLDYTQDVLVKEPGCHWLAELSAPDGTPLDRTYGNSVWKGGKGTFTASFSGTKIARSGKSGPYHVNGVEVSCGDFRAYQKNVVTSARFSASDFENTPADFSVSAENISAQAGVPAAALIRTESMGEFSGEIAISADGAPAGWVVTLEQPKVHVRGAVLMKVIPAADAAVGAHSLMLTATSGGLTHTVPAGVTITALPVSVSIQPSYATLHAGQTRRFTAQVSNSPDSGHLWRKPWLGTLEDGVYQAPAVIESASRDHVIAVSNLDGTKFARAFIDLLPPAVVAVNPAAVTLRAGEEVKVRASVTNVESPEVRWSMTPELGVLVQTNPVMARYTAPSGVGAARTVVVTATSVEDPSQSATMTISLRP